MHVEGHSRALPCRRSWVSGHTGEVVACVRVHWQDGQETAGGRPLSVHQHLLQGDKEITALNSHRQIENIKTIQNKGVPERFSQNGSLIDPMTWPVTVCL